MTQPRVRGVRPRVRPWVSLRLIPLIALAACGDGSSTDGAGEPAPGPTLAYVVARCREDTGGFVFGPDTLEIRRGGRDPVTVMEIPASSTPTASSWVYRTLGLGRALPGSLQNYVAIPRAAVSPDGSDVVFEVTDEFSPFPRNLSPQQKQIFVVRADGSGLRSLGPASRVSSGANFQGFTFSPDGRRVVFNDKGPDHAGNQANQVVVLDIATATRTQLTHLSGPPGSVCCPRFVDDETIAFGTTLDLDGSHPDGGAFTVRSDGTDLKVVPVPVVRPGSRIDRSFVITGDQPAAAIFSKFEPKGSQFDTKAKVCVLGS